MIINRQEILKGVIVYAIFDTAAALMLSEASLIRTLGMMAIGGLVYAIEIPNYFAWIEKRCAHLMGSRQRITKALLSVAYFNPLWIARHLFFIEMLNQGSSGWYVLTTASQAFLTGMPASAIANYFIQNKIKLTYRFLASSIFSGLMAIFYAYSSVLFN